MKKLTLKQIKNKIKKTKFEKFDLIIAIGRGGVEPGRLVSAHLKIPLKIINIRYRGKDNNPLYKKPIIKNKLRINNKKILVVDDVSRTGATLKKAKQILKNNKAKTFVINGKADYSLYSFKECIKWPW